MEEPIQHWNKNAKVIIVGNGPSVLEKENGELIDSFNGIVRLNDFKLEGFEKHTGKRVSTVFTCRLDCYSRDFIERYWPRFITCFLTDPWNGVKANPFILNMNMIEQSIGWDQLPYFRLQFGMTEPEYPSTGLMAIWWAIYHYGSVTITGFDNFKNGNRHYYEEGDRMDPSPHAPEIQERWIWQQQEKGLINIL